jgi:hypothetical protein
MSGFVSRILSADEIKALEDGAMEAARAGQPAAAWEKLQPLRRVQHHQRDAARSLLRIIYWHGLARERAADVALEIARSYHQDASVLSMLGECLEAVRDIDDLNAPPPDHPAFGTAADGLAALAGDCEGRPDEETVLHGLAVAARMMARQRDVIAEKSYRRLVELGPRNSVNHYNLGLFFKTRGRFEEGMKANQAAASLEEKVSEATAWNLGICATGGGHGAVALEVWKRFGHEMEIGRFGLPEGPYSLCKVKLAERPLAERTADTDDPGQEETIWIERLSPCHGIIRSVLFYDLGVNFGDVVLIDGAPITWHSYGDKKIPVHPHLATLVRQNYQFFDFAGTQEEPRQLAGASDDLPEDATIYAHSESFQLLCANCWRDPGLNHESHEGVQTHVVTGRIAAPGHLEPAQLLDQIDRAVAKRRRCHLYAPDLCAAAGLDARASVDKRRFDLLTQN